VVLRLDSIFSAVQHAHTLKSPVATVTPQHRNEVWSADFIFDRTAEGRVLKCLTIVGATLPGATLGATPKTKGADGW